MRYEIRIPEPCNEKWSEMTQTEKGAFCSNCKKEVIDYTNTSTYQLAKLLDKEEKLCGKFRSDQLSVEFSSVKKQRIPKTNYLLGLSMLFSIATPIFGQNKSAEIFNIEQSKQVEKDSISTKKQTDSIQINGSVFDENNAVIGATIIVKGTSYSTVSDFDGNFLLTIDRKEINKNLTLVFSHVGYKMQEVKIKDNTDFIKVRMVEDHYLLGEVLLVRKQNIFRRIENLFRRNK